MNENLQPGEFQFRFRAEDSDTGSNEQHNYELVYNEDDYNQTFPFQIIQPAPGSKEGILVNTVLLDYESDAEVYRMEIYASDNLHRSPLPLQVTVYLKDVNDVAPVFLQSNYSFTVFENEGDTEFQVTAVDNDGTVDFTILSYSILPLNEGDSAVPFFLVQVV